MIDETSIVHFVVTPYQHEDRSGFRVTSTFEGLRNRDHHSRVMASIAVNCVRQLGLIQGLEAALEEVCELAYQTRIETLPRITYADELEHDSTSDPDE